MKLTLNQLSKLCKKIGSNTQFAILKKINKPVLTLNQGLTKSKNLPLTVCILLVLSKTLKPWDQTFISNIGSAQIISLKKK
jgi:hypothetical protein